MSTHNIYFSPENKKRHVSEYFLSEAQGPVVQIIVSLMSQLVVKMLTVLVSTLSNSVIFAGKMWVAFANAKATHIFSAKILAYMPYLMIKVLTICELTTSLVSSNWALNGN